MIINKLNILVFISNLDGGGAQRTTINLINSFAKKGHNITLIVGSKSTNLPTLNYEMSPNIKLIILYKKKTILCFFNLIYYLTKENYDVSFSPSPEASTVLFYAAKMSFYRNQIILRESNYRSYKNTKKSLRYYLSRYAYRNADKIIALSDGVKIDLIHRYQINKHKIYVVNNPIDLEYINMQIKKNKYLFNHLKNKKDSDFHIIAIGRLVEQKGFDLLIESVSKLKYENIYLTIIGEGENRKILENQISSLNLGNRVFLKGFSKNPYVNLYFSDLFVLSSRWEGFGHVIVEAMACGTPVISFNCNSGPSDIITNGYNGILCKPESISDLSDQIKKLYNNKILGNNLVKNALKNIRKYDSGKISDKYIKSFID